MFRFLIKKTFKIQYLRKKSDLTEFKIFSSISRPKSIKRRTSKLDEILKKRPKMTIATKTRLDWDRHKIENNLDVELNKVSRSKNSLVEKNAFLSRTDHRTFERERDERLKRINNRKEI